MNELHVVMYTGDGDSVAGYTKGITTWAELDSVLNNGAVRYLALRDPEGGGVERRVNLDRVFKIEPR